MRHPIIGVGHSMGGTQLAELSLMHPRLLSRLVPPEPILQPVTPAQAERGLPYAGFAKLLTYRRDLWLSRIEAAKAMRTSPMFISWDARVWERFVKYGLRDTLTPVYPGIPEGVSHTDPPVTLTTPRNIGVHTFVRENFGSIANSDRSVDGREAHTSAASNEKDPVTGLFRRPEPQYVLSRLSQLQVPTLFVLDGKSFSVEPSAKRIYKLAGTGAARSSGEKEIKAKQVILDGVSHAVLMEAPVITAEAVAGWIREVATEWHKDEIV